MKKVLIFNVLWMCCSVWAIAQFEGKTSAITHGLGDQEIEYNNRAMLRFKPNGNPVLVYGFEKDGFYVRELDKDWMQTSKEAHFKGLDYYDMVVLDDNTLVVLATGSGNYSDAPSVIRDYNNIVYLIKMDMKGNVLFKTKVMGHEGFDAGKYFICSYGGTGRLTYDGERFSILLETCGNFANDNTVEPDVHQTDYFIQVDKTGKVIKESLSRWNSSHSSLSQLVQGTDKQVFTLVIGDAYPFGLNFCAYQNNQKTAQKTLYPEAGAKVKTAAIESSTDAGQIGSFQTDGEELVTVMATVASDKLPILQQKKDLLFFKWKPDGTIVAQKWIAQTPNIDEAMPFLMPYNGGWLLVYHEVTEEYQIDGKAVLVKLDKSGKMLGKPYYSDLNINWQSKFFTYPNGDIGWIFAAPYAQEIEIIKIKQ